MKTTKILTTFFLVCFCIACSKEENIPFDTEIIDLVDRTNIMPLRPDSTSLITLAGLEQSKWSGVKVEVSLISDRDVNFTYTAKIAKENAWYGNKTMRSIQIQKFKRELNNIIEKIYADTFSELPRSIIYRTVAIKLNQLAKSSARRKICCIYSDLLEKSNIDFYSPVYRKWILEDPGLVITEFTKEMPLSNLAGIEVHFMYFPKGYDDNNFYMAIVKIYRSMIEKAGGHVFVESNINY
ncbi:MAG: hypothetical protein Q8M15_17085 [Bacteroidota bacterium]|nr:hypothetical protein [Bacteroidota bacterium]